MGVGDHGMFVGSDCTLTVAFGKWKCKKRLGITSDQLFEELEKSMHSDMTHGRMVHWTHVGICVFPSVWNLVTYRST